MYSFRLLIDAQCVDQLTFKNYVSVFKPLT